MPGEHHEPGHGLGGSETTVAEDEEAAGGRIEDPTVGVARVIEGADVTEKGDEISLESGGFTPGQAVFVPDVILGGGEKSGAHGTSLTRRFPVGQRGVGAEDWGFREGSEAG